MSDYPNPRTSQVAITTPGGQLVWLGTLGVATGVTTSSTFPGGAEKMSCSLMVPAAYRSSVLEVGNTVDVYRGGHRIWNGVLDEPSPSTNGWAITAAGAGVQGQDFQATYTTWPAGQPDQVVNNAIARGLPWVNPGIGSPSGIWLGQQMDSGAQKVADTLNMACLRGGLSWFVNSGPGGAIGNSLSVAPLPTTPTRLLVAGNPVTRTNGGDVRGIWVRYQATADDNTTGAVATYATTEVINTGHGGSEQYLDLSNAGVLTLTAAQNVAKAILQIYQRSSFAGPFDLLPGSLLNMGGQPIDPGCEQAGEVYRLLLADFAYGGDTLPVTPVQFIGGAVEWNDEALTGTVTPYQQLDQSMSGMLSGVSQTMTPIST